MNDRRNDIKPETPGTCAWLLQHDAYKGWLSQHRGLLWIKGKPGAGKSTLLKYAFQAMKKDEPSNSIVALSFFFYGRGAEIQRTPLGLLRSLLHEFLQRFPGPLADVVGTFKGRRQNMGKPGEEWHWHPQELQDFIETSLPEVLRESAIRIFIDALDECGEKAAAQLVTYFQRLRSKCSSAQYGLSICFSCRHYPLISLKDGFEICVEHENHEDIKRYIRDELHDAIQRDMELEVLPDEILNRSSYIFQWVFLVLARALAQHEAGYSVLYIQESLRKTPQELDSLYENVLQSLGNNEDKRSQSLQLMQWICFARRPLSLTELRFAMIVDSNNPPYQSLQQCQCSPDFIKDDKSMEKQLKSLSGGLAEVMIHQDKPVAQFIHQSVNDYLVKDGLQILARFFRLEESFIGRAHFQLSRSCIRYITMDEIQGSRGKAKNGLIDEFPFLQYAVTSWLPHAQMAEIKEISQEDLLPYLRWPSALIIHHWVEVYRTIDPYSTETPLARTTLLLATSRCGLASVVRAILDSFGRDDVEVDSKDKYGQTPLWWAARNGHEAVLKLLLGTTANVEVEDDRDGRTPLGWAAYHGHEEVVKLLLEKAANVDARDRFGKTPQSWAAYHGRETIVKLLLEKAANMEAEDNMDGGTPLWFAACRGHGAVVKLLLEKAANVNARDRFGVTPLWCAAGHGDEVVTKLLLEKTANVDAKYDMDGRTPLSWAARNGHKAVVKLLLEKAANVEATDRIGRTPLSWAAYHGHEAVVKLLLEKAANVDARDSFGGTPLWWAASRGHEAVVKLLLETTANVEAEDDRDGRTPLGWAAYHGHEEVVKLLLEKAANVDARDRFGKTPLSWAAYRGREAVAQLLLEKAANVGVGDSRHGCTPR